MSINTTFKVRDRNLVTGFYTGTFASTGSTGSDFNHIATSFKQTNVILELFGSGWTTGGGETPVSVNVDYGDSTYDSASLSLPYYSYSFLTKVYASAGYYTITVIVTGSLSSTATQTMRIGVFEDMTDCYVDINLPETTESFGVALDPFNKQVLSSIDDLMYRTGIHLNNRYLKGQKILPSLYAPYGIYEEPNVYWEYFSPNNEGDLIYRAWDLALYGPPSWYEPNYLSVFDDSFYIESYTLKDDSITGFRDLVISYEGIELDVFDLGGGGDPEVSKIYTKNCYFDITSWISFYKWTVNPIAWKFQGCTFVLRNEDYPYLYFVEWQVGHYEIYDSCFVAIDFSASEEMYIYCNDQNESIKFENCYFSNNIIISDEYNDIQWDLNDGEPPVGTFPNITFVNCHFNHNFGSILPSALTATIAEKNTFNFNNFNVPQETDTDILQRWIDEDYNTGLFGEQRLGVGAFYFESTPEPVIVSSIVADYSVSIKEGCSPLTIAFTANCIGSPTYFRWYFGDGTSLVGEENPEHTYTKPGIYSPVLEIRKDDDFDVMIKTNYIIINRPLSGSDNTIIESYQNNGVKDWKFYVDSNLFLIFNRGGEIYKSGSPVIKDGIWTLVEFHPGRNQLYVSTVENGRKKITTYNISAGVTGMYTENKLLVTPNSSMKIDELRAVKRDEDLDDYFRSLKKSAYYLP